MKVLTLDMATATGWATNQYGRIESGVQTFDVKRGETQGMRWLRFNAWLRNWDSTRFAPVDRIGLILYEQNFTRGGAPTEVAMGFSTRVHEFVAQQRQAGFQMEHGNITATDLKKYTCGHAGKAADKVGMYQAALKKGWLEGMELKRIPQHLLESHVYGKPASKELRGWLPDDNEVDARCMMQYAISELKVA